MPFQVRTEQRPAAPGLDGTVHILADSVNAARAEVWPALGFNCFHWQLPWRGQTLELLYADPQFLQNPVPTRSGIPILFPFPNRIRDGRYSWQGKAYQLPLNSANKNAIHGFACREPWRVIGQGADADQAWIQGEFQASRDAPQALALWPADYRLRVTVRLLPRRLRMEAVVAAIDRTPLPFGLGYHTYFRVPLIGNAGDDCWVQAPARQYWQLEDGLPTGERPPVDAARDLNQPRRFSELNLDDVLTDLVPALMEDGLVLRGSVRQSASPDGPGPTVRLCTSDSFRELVAFTPPHRHAVALEPYTCTTDAINLRQRGVDAGWRVLDAGREWSAVVEMRCDDGTS